MKFSFDYFLFILFLYIQQTYLLEQRISDEHLGSTGKHLFHFVHVTDIHATHFGHADRLEQFEQFCNQIIKSLIKPQVTVISGDLTHNRDPGFSSNQYEQEWIMYRNILNRTNVTQHTAWLDMRGNHDVFMDPDPQSSKSLYRIYSHQGASHKGSYQYTLTTNDNDTYSFVGIDLCPRPGAGRPFNFLGHISEEEMINIKNLSEQTQNSNTTIFFGHYPLSFTYSKGLMELMHHGIAYLNGHLHTSIKYLYAQHSDGLLELELADWKDHRRFRIITIDSGLLSFEDFHFDQPIYTVISNPKAAKFKTSREPLYRLSQSTHIRIVIFSQWPIIDVKVSIDSKFLGNAIQSIDNQNLYVLQWNASYYHDGYHHKLSVEIKDNQNNKMKTENEFSLSTTTVIAWTLSKFILSIHWPTFGIISISGALCVYIIVLMFFRFRAKRMIPTQSCCGVCFTLWNKVRLRMMLLCSIDLFYYSLIGLALYHFIGPWYIGYLTDGHIGAVFLWGTIMRGMYLPPDMQTFMGTIQLLLFLFPLTSCLCSSCYYRYVQLQSSIHLTESNCHRAFRIYTVYLIFIYTVVFVLFWSFMSTASYKLAWIISPFGVALAAFSSFLFLKSKRLKIEDFKFQSITNEHDDSINENIIEGDDQQSIVTESLPRQML
ncbi:unnamed protein product [Rotaria socialis]|uniref:Calcineurin-like phosphoesterase domain-containing protein n=1 Tax=Rotaria socialis TaxID=392032 RepID=A0A821GZ72_9BILA|nr:unnamed protein product [Rotaria socialis]CAF4383205.1 unnamed protein product [Rotaria socialis]CAF4458717.1 unnamed protein product [Rotaria socialis]CAF4675082.1 unnamed protein product [Rotaria socialis]CAF4696781.1 unnamed protein product [Rotaria socialis]